MIKFLGFTNRQTNKRTKSHLEVSSRADFHGEPDNLDPWNSFALQEILREFLQLQKEMSDVIKPFEEICLHN